MIKSVTQSRIHCGQIFKDEGAQFISHEKCLPHWQRHPNADLVLPDRTVAGTDVLYVSDLVTPFSMGLGFMPDSDPYEWVRSLREIEARDDWSRIVGAHGIPVAPRAALEQRRRYLEALFVAVQAGINDGKYGDELYNSLELPEEFHDMRGYAEQLPRAAERIYHALMMGW